MEQQASKVQRPIQARARGVTIGTMKTGQWNALANVPGVRVGNCTAAFGRNTHGVPDLPVERVLAILRAHGRDAE